MHRIMAPEKRQELRDLLHRSNVTVSFMKTDGTDRVMNCTTNPDLIPLSEHLKPQANSQSKRVNANVQVVWDLDKNEWRSFKYDSVQYILHGQYINTPDK